MEVFFSCSLKLILVLSPFMSLFMREIAVYIGCSENSLYKRKFIQMTSPGEVSKHM